MSSEIQLTGIDLIAKIRNFSIFFRLLRWHIPEIRSVSPKIKIELLVTVQSWQKRRFGYFLPTLTDSDSFTCWPFVGTLLTVRRITYWIFKLLMCKLSPEMNSKVGNLSGERPVFGRIVCDTQAVERQLFGSVEGPKAASISPAEGAVHSASLPYALFDSCWLIYLLCSPFPVILVEENVKIFTRYELWNPLCEIKDHDDLTCVGLQDDENGSLNLSFPPDSSSFSLLLPDGYLCISNLSL